MSLETSELVARMQAALADEYLEQKGQVLPDTGREDRELLFTAIARGILDYFKSKENELIDTIELSNGGIDTVYDVTDLVLDIKPED